MRNPNCDQQPQSRSRSTKKLTLDFRDQAGSARRERAAAWCRARASSPDQANKEKKTRSILRHGPCMGRRLTGASSLNIHPPPFAHRKKRNANANRWLSPVCGPRFSLLLGVFLCRLQAAPRAVRWPDRPHRSTPVDRLASGRTHGCRWPARVAGARAFAASRPPPTNPLQTFASSSTTALGPASIEAAIWPMDRSIDQAPPLNGWRAPNRVPWNGGGGAATDRLRVAPTQASVRPFAPCSPPPVTTAGSSGLAGLSSPTPYHTL